MVCGLVVLAAPALDSQSTGSLMQGWLTLQPGVKSLRISSFDKSGGNNDRLEKIAQGERRTLADIKGPGQITHIWVTIAPPPPAVSRHDIILRMYWDDETTPSVEAPIGEFFGQGWNESYPMAALPLAAGPREGRAMVSYFPMPFRSRARIEVENDTGRQIDAFYYYVDYEQFPAGALPADTPYFHAWYHHELTEAQSYGENEWNTLGPEQKNTTGAGNFLVADITGRGHYVGMNYYVHSPSPMWYGEGDDLFQVDGEAMAGLAARHRHGGLLQHVVVARTTCTSIRSSATRASTARPAGSAAPTSTASTRPTRCDSRSHCACRSNTATTTTSRSTSRPWRTGTRPSRTRRSRPSPIANPAS